MSSIVNLRTGLGPVLSLFGAKDRWTSPLLKARTVPTLFAPTYVYTNETTKLTTEVSISNCIALKSLFRRLRR